MAELQLQLQRLARLDRLPRPARQGALARHARAMTTAEYETLHSALDAGAPDARHTALFLAVARRDLPTVTAALDDPMLRRRALAAAGRLPVPDEALTRLARTAPRDDRHDLYRLLRRARRHALADRLLPEVHERGDDGETSRLLPACSPAVVEQWLPRLAVPDGVLQSLARTAPRAVAAYLHHEAELPTDVRIPARLRDRLVTLLTRRDRAAGLDLLATRPELLPAAAVAQLLAVPKAVLEAVRARGIEHLPLPFGQLPGPTRQMLRALPGEDLAALAKVCRPTARYGPLTMPAPEPLLLLLDPAARTVVARELLAAQPTGQRPQPSLLLALDPADRASAVRAYLTGRNGREHRLAQLLRFLPLAEVEDRLARLAGDHVHVMRIFGWRALLQCAAMNGDPAEYGRVLRRTERAWHDHPQVRETVLQQAADTPGELLGAVPVDVLRDAALTVVQARDSSERCLDSTARWLDRTIRHAAAASDLDRVAELTAVLVQVYEHPRCTGTVRPLGLPRRHARALWARLRKAPGLRRPGRWLTLAELLPALPVIDARLEGYLTGEQGLPRARSLPGDHDPALPARAARLWLRDPATREERCAVLVRADASYGTVDEVLTVLARRRTDLLAPVLAAALDGRAGRLLPIDEPWTPRLPDHTAPEARAVHTALVGPVALDEEQPLRIRVAAAAALADPSMLLEVAARAPQPVAAAALLRLTHCGAPDRTVPVLLEHLGGGVRGRAAVRGLREALGRTPDAEGERVLSGVLLAADTPVGVAKELARALAGLPGPTAVRLAIAAWDGPGLHRDVRAVLGEVLAGMLDRPGVADRLSAWLGEPAVREAVLGTRPPRLPGPIQTAWEAFLIAATGHADPDVAEAAFGALLRRGHISEAMARAVAARLLTFGQAERVWRRALQVFTARPGEQAVAGVWPEVVERLAELARPADETGRAARRRLAELSGSRFGENLPPRLLDQLVQPLAAARLPGRAASAALAVATGALADGDPAPQHWDRCLDLIEGHPLRAGVLSEPGFRLGTVRPPADVVRSVLDRLRARGSTAAAALAVGLVDEIGRAERWPSHWQAELAAWRAHPDPDVAEAALLAGP